MASMKQGIAIILVLVMILGIFHCF